MSSEIDRAEAYVGEDDVPGSVRIRMDRERYTALQEAQNVFGVGNNADACYQACRFSQRMYVALQKAMMHPDMTDELAEILDTPQLSVSRTVEWSVGGSGDD